MVRKQVYIRADQDKRLKTLVAVTGKAEAELIRDGIDRVLVEEEGKKEDWKAIWMRAYGMWERRDDIPEIMDENRRRAHAHGSSFRRKVQRRSR